MLGSNERLCTGGERQAESRCVRGLLQHLPALTANAGLLRVKTRLTWASRLRGLEAS